MVQNHCSQKRDCIHIIDKQCYKTEFRYYNDQIRFFKRQNQKLDFLLRDFAFWKIAVPFEEIIQIGQQQDKWMRFKFINKSGRHQSAVATLDQILQTYSD
ncbi:UNKNOWN [Stylonychia lemnae]|uniref:Uncharacterized protein n=1 Tax=Stylonychia lemnae TaxID=5949 RepID=A0A078B5T9_STYLE|nr:UNKNOWN [Stylonychia lemnae]|eukprot:CDW89586.1 UNKNOWN [Stylonychia lemnae]